MLEPAELLALDDHLAECATCRRQLRMISQPQSALLALQESLQTSPTSFVARILDLVFPPGLSLPWAWRVAGAATVTALLILALTLWLRSKSGKPDDVVVEPSPIPSPTAQISITPSPEATAAIVALNDGGGQVTLNEQGNLTGLDALSPTDRRRVIQALQTRRVETPAELVKLRSSSGTVMGPGDETPFALLDPVGEIVLSDRPTLRWRPLGGATSYTVTITDPGNRYEEVAVSPALNQTQWQVDRALKRGGAYTWLVTAVKDDRKITAPSREKGVAKFKVLEQAKADELSRARREYAGSHLTLGTLYAQAGLLAEAEREFKTLAAANPQSPVVESLIRDLRAKRHAR
jgi:hypothetical protein